MKIVEAKTIDQHRNQLVDLLCDCVNDGASIGFIAPLSKIEAEDYWKSVDNELRDNSKVMFLAHENDRTIGAVQLSLCQKKNGLHRAEVEKLMVHPNARRKGAGKALMLELESKSRALQRSLLVLDTRKGDIAFNLYESLGYIFSGEIPKFVSNSEGGFDTTMFCYKHIKM